MAGALFVLLGLFGIAFPILPGLIFLIVGLIFFSILFPGVRRRIEARTKRFPKVHAAFVKLETWISRIVGPLDTENS